MYIRVKTPESIRNHPNMIRSNKGATLLKYDSCHYECFSPHKKYSVLNVTGTEVIISSHDSYVKYHCLLEGYPVVIEEVSIEEYIL